MRVLGARLLAGAVTLTAITLFGGPLVGAPAASAATAVNGGGSGFAALEVQQWQADTARKPFNLSVNYSSQSSGVGRTNFASGLYDYGVSDIIYQPDSEQGLLNQMQAGRCGGRPTASCFRYVPISAGGLSFMYNLVNGSSRITNLRLTSAQVCGIFTQQIKTWNDPSLVGDNPELASNTAGIEVVSRSDQAGESYVLSQYCMATQPGIWNAFRTFQMTDPNDPDPQEMAQNQPISVWPANLASLGGFDSQQETGADAVADQVADPASGKNSITYDAAGYAAVRNFPVASVQNSAGVYTQPVETNVNVALGYATGRGDGTFILDFTGPDPRAYFPSTYSYALVQTTGEDPGKGATLGGFLCYAVGQGQVIAPQLAYARLSSAIVAISVAAITAMPGAPSAAACTAGAPPAPAAPTVLGGAGAASAASGGALAAGAAGGAGGTGAGSAGGVGGDTATTLSAAQQAANKALQEAAGQLNGSSAASKAATDSNADAMWYLLLGAIVCAIGVGVTSGRRSRA